MITIESIQNGRKYRKKQRNTERYNEIKEGRKEKRKTKSERTEGEQELKKTRLTFHIPFIRKYSQSHALLHFCCCTSVAALSNCTARNNTDNHNVKNKTKLINSSMF